MNQIASADDGTNPGSELHLWVTARGTPLIADSFYKMAVRRMTRSGRRQMPHMFRDAAATWIAIDSPDQVRMTCSILLRHLETVVADTFLVCADKVHNARAIVTDLKIYGPAIFERFKAGAKGTVMSGASSLRPGHWALLEAACQAECGVIVVEALNRLSRDQEDVACFFKRCRFA